MLQLQRTRPKQSKTKDDTKLQHPLQRKMKNILGMFVYLTVIAFYVLTIDIWLGTVKFFDKYNHYLQKPRRNFVGS